MSAELIASLASSGMTQREAAAKLGMPYRTFRDLRDLYPDIKWRISAGQRAGLRTLHKLDTQKVAEILADTRMARLIADDYGVSLSTIYNIRARRIWLRPEI